MTRPTTTILPTHVKQALAVMGVLMVMVALTIVLAAHGTTASAMTATANQRIVSTLASNAAPTPTTGPDCMIRTTIGPRGRS